MPHFWAYAMFIVWCLLIIDLFLALYYGDVPIVIAMSILSLVGFNVVLIDTTNNFRHYRGW